MKSEIEGNIFNAAAARVVEDATAGSVESAALQFKAIRDGIYATDPEHAPRRCESADCALCALWDITRNHVLEKIAQGNILVVRKFVDECKKAGDARLKPHEIKLSI